MSFTFPTPQLFGQVLAEQQRSPEIDEDALLDLNEPTNASQDDGMKGADAGQRAEVDNAQFAAGSDLADVVLEVEGKELHVNRAVLAQFSPMFARMFFADGFKEKDQSRIPLPGKSYATFTTFLQLMYPQSPNAAELISDENLARMLELADEYQSDHVKTRCLEYIKSQLFEYYLRCHRSAFPVVKDEMVNRMMLYFWMCDHYCLSESVCEMVLGIFKDHVTDVQSMKKSPCYDLMPPDYKVKLLEAAFDGTGNLDRAVEGGFQKMALAGNRHSQESLPAQPRVPQSYAPRH